MKNKIISIVLSLILFITLMGPLASEAAFEASEYGEEIYFLRDLGLVGEKSISDTELSRRMTRGEFADIAVQIMGFADEAAAVSYTPKYTDVLPEHPYAKSILFATNLGMFTGVSDTEFAPDEPVYMSQAIKVAVCMAGFEMLSLSYGGYPSGYMRVAREIGILQEILADDTSGALRGEIFQLMYNTVNTDMAIQSEFGDAAGFITQEGRTILSEYHSIFKSEGIVEANYYAAIKGEATGIKDKIRINGIDCYTPADKYISMIGRNVIFYYHSDGKTNKLLAAYDNNNTQFIFESNSDLKFNYTEGYYEHAGIDKTRRFNIGREYDVIYNGEVLDISDPLLMKPACGTVTLIDNNDDRIYDVVIIDEYYNLVVYSYDSYTEEIHDIASKKGDFSRNLSLYNYETVIICDKTGSVLSTSSIKANNVISVYKNRQNHYIKLVVSDDFFSGKISEKTAADKIVAGGVTYKFSSDLRFDPSTLNFTNEYIFYLDSSGEVVYITMQSSNDLGYIVDIKKSTGLDSAYYIKVFSADEEMSVFELADKVTITKSPSNSSSLTPDEVNTLMQSDKRNLYLLEKDKDGKVKKIIYPYVVNTKDEFENMPVYPFFKLDYLIKEWPDITDSGRIQYVEKQYGFSGWLAMPQAAFTFDVPVLSNLSPADNFFSVTPISEYDENTKFTLNKTPTGADDELEFYSLNYDSFLADVLVHYVDTAQTNQISQSSSPVLVTSVTQGIDEQTGDEVIKLKVMAGTKERTLYLDDESLLKREKFSQQKIVSALPELHASKQEIKPGDIIVYHNDEFANRVTAAALLYDLENNKPSYSQSGYNILFRFEMATVKRVDRGYLEIESSHGIERCYLGPTAVTIYDKKFGKAYAGTTSDLAIGDKVGIYFKWTQNLNTIIYKER